MNFKTAQRWIALNAVLILTMAPLALVSFQNCAPKVFSTMSNSSLGVDSPPGTPGGPNPQPCSGPCPVTTPTPTGSGGFALTPQTEKTSFNTPISWVAEWSGDRTGYVYSFDYAQNTTSIDATCGHVELTDSTAWKLTYTPAFGFRGECQISVFGRKSATDVVTATLTLQVGNAVNLLAPALAVRGMGCITCHAEVHSNIITDFGLNDWYYFGQTPPPEYPTQFTWDNGLIYGDHYAAQKSSQKIFQGAWWTLNLENSTAGTLPNVIVPKANLPAGPAAGTGTSTIAQYVQYRLSDSYYASSRAGTAIEKSSIYIGAPTAARLKSVFGWTASDTTKRSKYIRDANGWNLSGLNIGSSGPSNGSYFTNTGNLVCEGDVMLDGTVYLNNLTVDSRTGCRLYATGSVFIYGPIAYVNSDTSYANRNLQISSATSILMGFGALWKNGTHCEQNDPDSGYWDYYNNRAIYTAGFNQAQTDKYLDGISDSAKYRLTYFWGRWGFLLRNDTRNGSDINLAIYNEMQNTIGSQMDAACRPETRAVAYSRLLLNAPIIESRYAGGFSGSIIAEVGLMSIGLAQNQSRFKFVFDPVFQNVDVLPLLKEQDFLHVE